MCDYSLHLIASRPAKVGDKLVATEFCRSITRGFSATGTPKVTLFSPRVRNSLRNRGEIRSRDELIGKAQVAHKVALSDRSTSTIRMFITMRWNFPTGNW